MEYIYIEDDTLINLSENEGEAVTLFYEHVVKFHEKFVTKLLKVFDFKS